MCVCFIRDFLGKFDIYIFICQIILIMVCLFVNANNLQVSSRQIVSQSRCILLKTVCFLKIYLSCLARTAGVFIVVFLSDSIFNSALILHLTEK